MVKHKAKERRLNIKIYLLLVHLLYYLPFFQQFMLKELLEPSLDGGIIMLGE